MKGKYFFRPKEVENSNGIDSLLLFILKSIISLTVNQCFIQPSKLKNLVRSSVLDYIL